jgi:G:T-mismatch repair DNA endonuclease (very short patch repair protein)
MFRKGHKPWNKGLTKETDVRLMEVSRSLKGHVVKQDTRDKLSVSKLGVKLTEEHSKNIGIASKKRWVDPEYKKSVGKKISEARIGMKFTDEHAKNIGIASKKRWQNPEYRNLLDEIKHADEYRDNISVKAKERYQAPAYIEKMRKLHESPEFLNKLRREKHTDEWKQNISLMMKEMWKNPEFAEMQAAKMLEGNMKVGPNKPEKKLLELLNTIFPNTMKYTGDGSFWIMGRNPDFININGKKQAIELLGCYWHGCPEHFPDVKKQKKFNTEVKLLKGFGYSTLGVWEHELEDIATLTTKLKEFIEA